MALHANALIQDLAELKDVLRVKSSEDDIDLERLVNAMTVTFESEAGRPLRKRTLTDYRLDGTGTNKLYLPFVPVSNVTKVQIRYDYNDAVYRTITDTAQFVLKSGDLGLLQLVNDWFIRGDRNILVTMDVGFQTTDMEFATAIDLMYMQIAHSFRMVKNGELGLTNKTYSDGSVSFFPASRLLKEVADGLLSIKDWSGN